MATTPDQSAVLLDESGGRSSSLSEVDNLYEEKYPPVALQTTSIERRQLFRYWLYFTVAFLKSAFLLFLHSLIPSFLRKSDLATKYKSRPTEYLNGIRGVVTIFIVLHQFIIDWYPHLDQGYGASPDDKSFFQLPIIRLFYTGRGMIPILFLISGYLLSYKALRLIHDAQYSMLLDSLASSVFRRGLRLFIPTIVSSFLSLLIARRSWYRLDPLGRNLMPSRLGNSFRHQLRNWLGYAAQISNPFDITDVRKDFTNPYSSQLWIIPLEFRGSLTVFMTVLGLSKVASTTRLKILGFIAMYALFTIHWDIFLFLSGTIFAELELASIASHQSFSGPLICKSDVFDHVSNFSRLSSSSIYRKKNLVINIAITSTFVFALYLLSFPEGSTETPGYIILAHFVPKRYTEFKMPLRFWQALGSILAFGIILCSPTLQKPFTTRFAQYLGRISFALYLVHPQVLFTVGMKMLYGALKEPVDWKAGAEENWQPLVLQYGRSFVLAAVVNGLLCFWYADWLWRVVDAGAVKWSWRISERLWIKE